MLQSECRVMRKPVPRQALLSSTSARHHGNSDPHQLPQLPKLHERRNSGSHCHFSR